MTGENYHASAAARAGKVLPFRRPPRLFCWARRDGWDQLHYMRDGTTACGLVDVGLRASLVGSIKDRELCPKCETRRQAVTS